MTLSLLPLSRSVCLSISCPLITHPSKIEEVRTVSHDTKVANAQIAHKQIGHCTPCMAHEGVALSRQLNCGHVTHTTAG
jgi:hypothetical protein